MDFERNTFTWLEISAAQMTVNILFLHFHHTCLCTVSHTHLTCPEHLITVDTRLNEASLPSQLHMINPRILIILIIIPTA